MASGPITTRWRDGETVQTVTDYFLGLPNHCRWWLQSWNQKTLAPWKKNCDQSRQHIKKQRHYFADKGLCSQSYGFSSSHVWMWELDYKESWALNNLCFWTVVLEKTHESPLDCRRSNQSILKKINPEYSLEGLILKLKVPILWPPDMKSWLRKDSDVSKDWRQQEKRTAEDEMLDGITESKHVSLRKLLKMVKDREAWHAAVQGVAKSGTHLSD